MKATANSFLILIIPSLILIIPSTPMQSPSVLRVFKIIQVNNNMGMVPKYYVTCSTQSIIVRYLSTVRTFGMQEFNNEEFGVSESCALLVSLARAIFVNRHGRNDFPRRKGLFCFNTAHLATQRRPILLSIVTNAIASSGNVLWPCQYMAIYIICTCLPQLLKPC